MRFALSAVLFLSVAGAADAQDGIFVRKCDATDRISSLAEPWEQNTDQFANGDVRIAVIDRVEPAATSFSLLVMSPPRDELGGRICQVVMASEGTGFGGFDFGERGAAYDAQKGLLFDVPVSIYDPASGDFFKRQLSLTIRQDTGEITGRVLQ
ncbi:MAG: hypothetical protein DI498_12850 [Paracoccus denitrificans]|nr:MAG: hypothetical protein DI498_12850 [Paracoccus denitrificans]PZO83140.1 MAG: hypothetical protein DI633_12850 [Paracoccus denitrificans]